jgi:hypothetical protein
MVLSGTLREFILADVMQLLTQQKITGKLILDNGRTEGHIVFKNGSIVAAVCEQESFPLKLFYYLTEIQQQPKNKVRELFSSYEGKVAELIFFLENKSIMNHQELEAYALGVTIDIACSLFLWKTGKYRFDSLRTVDHLIPAGIDIPVENVVMEAMRRIDEWHRMREVITEETIFVHTEKKLDLSSASGPLENPSLYLYHRIDGTSAVKIMLNDTFLTEYKIYETLYSLMQEDLIQPLSENVTKSILAAIQKKEQDSYAASLLPPFISISATIGLILLILLLAWLFRGIILSKMNIRSSLMKNSASITVADDHFRDALIYFRAKTLSPHLSTDGIPDFFSINRKDVHYLIFEKRL